MHTDDSSTSARPTTVVPPEPRALGLDEQLSLLSGQNYWQTRAIPERGIPAVWVADGTNGLRVSVVEGDNLGVGESLPATCFPPASTLASSWDEPLVRSVGEAVGREARALGVGVVLGPGLNIKRHPRGGRNFEYLSEDPLVSGRLAAAVVEGIQSCGVGACLKHFAVNNHELRKQVSDAIVDERTRREIYLRGFEIAVTRARPRMVMAAYNKINGTYCADDPELLTTILRDEWGFEGAVVSDWGGEMDRVAGVLAGLDLEMPGGLDRVPELRAAVATGRLTRQAVERSARRVLALTDLATDVEPERGSLSSLTDAHDALARHAAASSAVVLTNDGVLPLDRGARVALIGAFAEHPRYQGGGSAFVNPLRVTTALDALREAGVEVTYEPGYDPVRPVHAPDLIAAAASAARRADVAVVMVGLPAVDESEGYDRDTLTLPAQHDALVRAVSAVNPRTVVVLANGAPVLMPWHSQVAAILECYLGGQASGGALADNLLGVVEPAGRLAETFPASPEDVPSEPYFPAHRDQAQYREGVFVGYRYATSAGVEPLFAFGHGLGYGSTAWSEVDVDRAEVRAGETVTVSLTVENTGDRSTSDVVQVYAHDRSGVVLRPRRELVGFSKVHLGAGERARVDVTVEPELLAFWDVSSGGWRTPRGLVDLEVGRSSALIEATVTVDVLDGVDSSEEPPGTPMIAADDADFARRLGRPIPEPAPARPFTRLTPVGDFAATFIGRTLRKPVAAAAEKTAVDDAHRVMVRRVTDEMPLQGLVINSGGRMSWRTLDALIALGNRRPLRALRHLLATR